MIKLFRSVADLEVFCRLTFGVSDTIRAIAPIPYRDVKLGPKQKFGYYTSGKSSSRFYAFLESTNKLLI